MHALSSLTRHGTTHVFVKSCCRLQSSHLSCCASNQKGLHSYLAPALPRTLTWSFSHGSFSVLLYSLFFFASSPSLSLPILPTAVPRQVFPKLSPNHKSSTFPQPKQRLVPAQHIDVVYQQNIFKGQQQNNKHKQHLLK